MYWELTVAADRERLSGTDLRRRLHVPQTSTKGFEGHTRRIPARGGSRCS